MGDVVRVEEFMTKDECAKYIKVSPRTIERWVHEKTIPYRKHGHQIRFHKNDLDQWSEQGRVMPQNYGDH